MTRVAHGAQTVCTNSVVYAEHLLACWESGNLVSVRQKVLTQGAPDKIPGG